MSFHICSPFYILLFFFFSSFLYRLWWPDLSAAPHNESTSHQPDLLFHLTGFFLPYPVPLLTLSLQLPLLSMFVPLCPTLSSSFSPFTSPSPMYLFLNPFPRYESCYCLSLLWQTRPPLVLTPIVYFLYSRSRSRDINPFAEYILCACLPANDYGRRAGESVFFRSNDT